MKEFDYCLHLEEVIKADETSCKLLVELVYDNEEEFNTKQFTLSFDYECDIDYEIGGDYGSTTETPFYVIETLDLESIKIEGKLNFYEKVGFYSKIQEFLDLKLDNIQEHIGCDLKTKSYSFR